MSIQETIGAENYEKLRTTLAKSFPSTNKVTDAMVDELVRTMWRDYKPEYANLGVPDPGPQSFAEELPPEGPEGASFPLYIAQGRHTRTLRVDNEAPMQSDFIGYLPQVRVTLPQSLTGTDEDILRTQIGDVYLSGDHLVGSIDLIIEKYVDGTHLDYRPERVDLITPARLGGTRFGAIALYLGYRSQRDVGPSFYILEAGTATGDAKVLYFGSTIDTVIDQLSWYKPTPFSSDQNRYRGWVNVDGSDPVEIAVECTQSGHSKHYMTVTVSYQKVPTLRVKWPGDLILEAALRVAAIAEAMGVPSGEPAEAVLAAGGRAQTWIHEPKVLDKSSAS